MVKAKAGALMEYVDKYIGNAGFVPGGFVKLGWEDVKEELVPVALGEWEDKAKPLWADNVGTGMQFYRDANTKAATPKYSLENIEKEIARLQAQKEKLTRPKLDETEAEDVSFIVNDLIQKGAFLGGSREKLNDFDYTSLRDWDFHVQKEGNYPYAPKFIRDNFFQQDGEEAVNYEDKFFKSYWKHDTYPHITVIVNSNLTLYKKIWTKLPKSYWHNYVWKSNPMRIEELKDPAKLKKLKLQNREFFNVLHEMVELDFKDCM